ncbi:MAG: ABC transporter, partial [Pseudomonadota bacterium]
ANRPKILLADEPTGNLDTQTSDEVFAALLDLVRSEGLAALIATHDRDLAKRMDLTVSIDQGVLVAAAA